MKNQKDESKKNHKAPEGVIMGAPQIEAADQDQGDDVVGTVEITKKKYSPSLSELDQTLLSLLKPAIQEKVLEKLSPKIKTPTDLVKRLVDAWAMNQIRIRVD